MLTNLMAQLQLWMLRDDERGQALVEYALILALVSVVAIAALQAIGAGVTNTLNTVAGDL